MINVLFCIFGFVLVVSYVTFFSILDAFKKNIIDLVDEQEELKLRLKSAEEDLQRLKFAFDWHNCSHLEKCPRCTFPPEDTFFNHNKEVER
jgi:hypothetical protein